LVSLLTHEKKTRLDDVDVVFDPTPLTEREKTLISENIQQDKARGKKKQRTQTRAGEVREKA
jgi:hypothetical protein